MGVQELHRAYRTPHAERTYHLHRVRPHVAERKRRTHGQSVRVRVSALPHPAESGNHPAPQVQRLRVFVHRNPLQGFSSPALRLYRVLGESGTDARLHPYRSRTAVDCPRRTLHNLRTAAPDGLLRSRVELVERIGTAGGERREINITPTRIYPRQRLIPELRRSGYGKQLPDVTPFDLIHLLLSENKAETLLKAGQTALVRFFARSSRNIADYWPAIRIAIRNGYAIGKPTEWCDYIDLLRFFGKDLHNAHFVCPADLPAAHDLYMAKKRRHMQMERRQEERRKALEQEASFVEAKGRFFGVEFSDGEICIKVLDSVEAIRQEGEAMHHCVFTNEYYLKADSLILSATIDGKRIETIEVSLKRMEVVQSRGVCNKNTPYHGQILKLMKGNMSLIRKRMTA